MKVSPFWARFKVYFWFARPYCVAFIAAFLVQLMPTFAQDQLPDSRQLAGAVIAGLLATHLLDRASPRQKQLTTNKS